MKLYILSRTGPTGYNETYAVVVRASSPKKAREFAARDDHEEIWLDTGESSCRVLQPEGAEGVVMRAGL